MGRRQDSARSHREATRRDTARKLSIAQKQSLIAQRHAAQLLVTIYEGQSPDLIQLLVGSSKLSDVINAVQYTRDVASSAQHVAAAAVRARDRLTAATARLQRSERTRRATLAQLDSRARDHRGDAHEAAGAALVDPVGDRA